MAHPADSRARRRFGASAGALLLAALAACGSPPKPVEVTWHIAASADVNPSVTNRPSPLRLRVYELKSSAKFTDADFMALYNADEATLAKDIVAREEIDLVPGQAQTPKKVLNAETQFVAVMAAYRDVEHATWRAIAPVQPGKTKSIDLQAKALAVTIVVSP